jgi:hypothetical protein
MEFIEFRVQGQSYIAGAYPGTINLYKLDNEEAPDS